MGREHAADPCCSLAAIKQKDPDQDDRCSPQSSSALRSYRFSLYERDCSALHFRRIDIRIPIIFNIFAYTYGMKSSEAIKMLREFDVQGRYVYRKADLRVLFDEAGSKLDQTLRRLVHSGVLQRAAHGIYLYALSSHIGTNTIELIARNLRRGELVYESLESALSEYGLISQIPIDRLILMTTGRSGECSTPYGTIEFVHTKRSPEKLQPELIEREGHAIPIASKKLAITDLRHVRRNLDLLDEGIADD